MLEKTKKIEPFAVKIEGEVIVIDQEMIDKTDIEIMEEYRRMLWAAEQRERRGRRCLNPDGTRCTKKKCSECPKAKTGEKRNGAPLSIDRIQETGMPLVIDETYKDGNMPFAKKSERDKKPMSVGLVSSSIEELLLKKEQHEALYAAIDTLDEEGQLIVRLHLEELSDHKIAEQTGIAQTTVSYRRKRYIEKITKILQDF